jgi:penicillin-binding protein 1B
VRAKYKLNFPAAGKTGTSHDGWFAGYTSELLCVVWVGFDDNKELDLEGAHSAAPIWAQFMQSAMKLRQYRDVKPFRAPQGVVSMEIDPLSGMPASSLCPSSRSEVYIAGTQPVGSCPLHSGGGRMPTHITSWDTAPAAPPSGPPAADSMPRVPAPGANGQVTVPTRQVPPAAPATDPASPDSTKKNDAEKVKKGFLRRLLGVFK